MSVEPHHAPPEAFKLYSRRLIKELEPKGIIRTAVESVNLALCTNHHGVLMAECIRTFPSFTFPASLLLKREETRKLAGASVIAAVHDSKHQRSRAYMEPPMDLLYGFRGKQENVDLLSSYEMLMHWSMEKILPPSLKIPQHAQKSCLTPEGLNN